MSELLSLRGPGPFVNEGLSVPPVMSLHDAWSEQPYALGTKFWDGDRCFKLAKAGSTLKTTELACMNDYQVLGWTVAPTQPAGSGGAGNTKLRVTIGTTDGVAADGAVAANSLVGGYITIFRLNAGTNNTDYTFRITGNTVVASNGGVCDLTVANALPYAVLAGSAYTEITGNPYEDVRTDTAAASQKGRAHLGLPMAPATTTNCYVWLQSWGPTWMSPQTSGTEGVGTEYDRVQIVARYDGSVQNHAVYTAGATASAAERVKGVHQQHVGFVFTRAGNATTQGTPLMFLQISC